MTFEQIIQLSQAGFTAEQIAAIAPLISSGVASPAVPATPTAPSTTPSTETPAVPATPTVPVTPTVPAVPAVPTTPTVPSTEPTMADVIKQLGLLTSAINANAIINSNQPANNPASAEDALASIVMPTK